MSYITSDDSYTKEYYVRMCKYLNIYKRLLYKNNFFMFSLYMNGFISNIRKKIIFTYQESTRFKYYKFIFQTFIYITIFIQRSINVHNHFLKTNINIYL